MENYTDLFQEISKFLNTIGNEDIKIESINLTTKEGESIDLTTKEGRERFNNIVELLQSNSLFKLLYSLIGGRDFENDMNILKDFTKEIEEKEQKKEVNKIERPSEKLDNVNVKLQIHKLVDEYCDEYIRPYTPDDESGKKLSNDAYAALFEFACWIFNKK